MKKLLKIIIPILFLVLLIGSVFGYITNHDNNIYTAMQEQIIVSDKTVELQKGEVEILTNDVVNLNNLDCTALFENGNDKINIYAETVGEQLFKVIITANNTLAFDKIIELNVKIIIADTTSPEFTESIDEIKITQGDELDLLSKFKAEDLSGKVELSLSGDFDNNKIGEQIIKIIAKDINGNIAEKDVKVTVAEKAVALSNNRSTRNANNSSSNNSSRPASNGGSSSSSNNGGSSSSNNNTPTTNGCANGNHSMGVGDIGRWFNSRSEVQTYVNKIISEWRTKLVNGTITQEEYNQNAPTGYSGWSCANCGKWTGNFKYR